MATKILLADDSITIQKVVELTFSEGGYEVLSVSNGQQALEKIPEWNPDIALLDVIMPEKSGYEVCHEVRNDPRFQKLPVLLLTGTFEPFDPERARSAGADGHITKPFESRTLIAKVEELLAARPDRVEAVVEEAPEVPAAEPVVQAPGRETPDWTADDFGQDFPTAAEIEKGFGKEPRWQPGSSQPDPLLGPATAAATPAAGIAVTGGPEPGPGGTLGAAPETGEPREAGFGRTMAIEIPTGMADRHTPATGTPIDLLPPERSAGDSGPAAASRPETAERAGGPESPPAPAADEVPKRPGPDPAPKGVDLSRESIDTIARRVVEKLTDQVVREIAWEVVPDLAETLIRKRIQELEDQIGES